MNVSAMQVPLEKRCPGSVNINGMTHIRFNSDGTPSTADKTDGGCQPTSSNDAVAHKDVEAGLGNRGTPVKVPCRDKKKPSILTRRLQNATKYVMIHGVASQIM